MVHMHKIATYSAIFTPLLHSNAVSMRTCLLYLVMLPLIAPSESVIILLWHTYGIYAEIATHSVISAPLPTAMPYLLQPRQIDEIGGGDSNLNRESESGSKSIIPERAVDCGISLFSGIHPW
jgi:hypothetical protein